MSAMARFDRAAVGAVAAANAAETGDVAKASTELTMANIAVKASAAVTKSNNEVLGTLFDFKV